MENRINLWTDVVSAVKKTIFSIFLKYTIEQKSKDWGHISQYTLYLWLKTLYNELVENVGCPLLKPKVHSLDFSLKLTRVHCFVKQSFLYLLWMTALRAQECCHPTSFQPLKRHVTTVGSASLWNSKDSGKKKRNMTEQKRQHLSSLNNKLYLSQQLLGRGQSVRKTCMWPEVQKSFCSLCDCHYFDTQKKGIHNNIFHL